MNNYSDNIAHASSVLDHHHHHHAVDHVAVIPTYMPGLVSLAASPLNLLNHHPPLPHLHHEDQYDPPSMHDPNDIDQAYPPPPHPADPINNILHNPIYNSSSHATFHTNLQHGYGSDYPYLQSHEPSLMQQNYNMVDGLTMGNTMSNHMMMNNNHMNYTTALDPHNMQYHPILNSSNISSNNYNEIASNHHHLIDVLNIIDIHRDHYSHPQSTNCTAINDHKGTVLPEPNQMSYNNLHMYSSPSTAYTSIASVPPPILCQLKSNMDTTNTFLHHNYTSNPDENAHIYANTGHRHHDHDVDHHDLIDAASYNRIIPQLDHSNATNVTATFSKKRPFSVMMMDHKHNVSDSESRDNDNNVLLAPRSVEATSYKNDNNNSSSVNNNVLPEKSHGTLREEQAEEEEAEAEENVEDNDEMRGDGEVGSDEEKGYSRVEVMSSSYSSLTHAFSAMLYKAQAAAAASTTPAAAAAAARVAPSSNLCYNLHMDIQDATTALMAKNGIKPPAAMSHLRQQHRNHLMSDIDTLHGRSAHTHTLHGNHAASALARRRAHGTATDAQSVAARTRREKFSERIRTLQGLVPNADRLDTVSMLGRTLDYVRFLQHQVWSLYHGLDPLETITSCDSAHEKWKDFIEHEAASNHNNNMNGVADQHNTIKVDVVEAVVDNAVSVSDPQGNNSVIKQVEQQQQQ